MKGCILFSLVILLGSCTQAGADASEGIALMSLASSLSSGSCRTFSTSSTFTTGGSDYAVTAGFNSSMLEYKRTFNENVVIQKYASIKDFVDEALPIGKILYLSVQRTEGSIVNHFESGKLTGQTSDLTFLGKHSITTSIYSSWDHFNRPLFVTHSSTGDQVCAGLTTASTYDDVALSITQVQSKASAVGAGCAPIPVFTGIAYYDSNGNQTRSDIINAGAAVALLSSETLTTETVCY